MVRYDEFINTVELFTTTNHYFKGFGHGSIDKIDAAVNRGYPLLFVRPIQSFGLTGIDGRERRLTFEFYSLDVPKLGDEDMRKVLSNTEQGLYDLFGYILDGPVQYSLQMEMVSITPLVEAFQDKAAGWVMTASIVTDAVGISYCEIA